MILSGKQIALAIDNEWKLMSGGKRLYSGSDGVVIGSNSLDVRLGNEFLSPSPYSSEYDVKTITDNKVLMNRGDFLLAHTQESIDCSAPLFIREQWWYFVPMLEGRSTWARKSLSIHDAGFGDYSFAAPWVLELSCVLPVEIQAGQRIGQLFFSAMITETDEVPTRYDGAYVNQRGATPAVTGEGRF
jgi:dCTP deaminase